MIKRTFTLELTYNTYIILRLAGVRMADDLKRSLKVFLCHASGDKPAVRELYKYLIMEGVDAWLDEEKFLPGQDWNEEILKALQRI